MSASGTVAPPYPGDDGDDASNYTLRASAVAAASAASNEEEDEALTMAHLSALRDFDGDGLEDEGRGDDMGGLDNSDESTGVNHPHQMQESAYREHAFESDSNAFYQPSDSTVVGDALRDFDESNNDHHQLDSDANSNAGAVVDADTERSPFETLLAALTRLPREYHDHFMRLWMLADTSSSEEDYYGRIPTQTLPGLLWAAAADARAQIQRGGETTRAQRNAREFVALATRLDDVCVALLHS
jgi:hypothetical protein